MNILNKIVILGFTCLSFSLLPAQTELGQETYWIYTSSNEMKDYQINSIEGDNLVINNGDWDVKISITEIELIALPPKPGFLGQVLGGGIGGYCGGIVGMIPGFIIWIVRGGSTGGSGGPDGSIIFVTGLVGAGAGVFYGSKFGGNLLKGPPETLADMAMWNLDEKKEWIQNSLINSY